MNNCFELYTLLLDRLEMMARRLLEMQFHSLQELWQLEIDLAKYQSEIQKAIIADDGKKKDISAEIATIALIKSGNWKTQVQQLQDELKNIDSCINMRQGAYRLSRQLGDSLAWILLGRNLIPLTRTSSEPSSDGHKLPDAHGLQGMIAAAEVLSNAGAGFPILHDLTNCLRTGDITFWFPGKEMLTIEVKTHDKGHTGDVQTLIVEIHLVQAANDVERWNDIFERLPKEIPVPSSSHTNETAKHRFSNQLEKRLLRQLERMITAKVWQTAQPYQPIKLGKWHEGIVTSLDIDHDLHHWDIVSKLTIKAKADGFAACTVDDAFVYLVMRSDEPFWLRGVDMSLLGNLPSHLLSDSFLLPDPAKNFLWTAPANENVAHVLPFFLYPLPIDLIIDIMWGRLAIVVIANLGKLVEGLQKAGLDAKFPKSANEVAEKFLSVTSEFNLADDRAAEMELKGLHYYAAQIGHEFLSLEGFTLLVTEMVNVGIERFKSKVLEDDKAEPDEVG